MINTNTFDQLISCSQDNAREILSTYLEAATVSFKIIENFPCTTGIYFIYKNEVPVEPIYIGSAFAENRSIRIRCNQYLQKGSGGDSFRGKVEKLKNISSTEAIKYIKNNFSAKFIKLPDTEKNKIKQLEQITIWAFSPKLNFILKQFCYENTNLQKKLTNHSS